MDLSWKKIAVAGASTVAIFAAVAPAIATTYSVGSQSWQNGTTTGRYRSHAGTHYVKPGCSGGVRPVIDVRVDVIDKPDVSEGKYSYTCNSAGIVHGHIDSYGADYRGHFMQSGNDWYGSLSDQHP